MEKAKKIKVIITSVLLGLTLAFIWGNSMLSMQESGEESQSIYSIVETIGKIFFGEAFTHSFGNLHDVVILFAAFGEQYDTAALCAA